MRGAEGGLNVGKILLHSRAEHPESAQAKVSKARLVRRAEAQTAAAHLLARARNAAAGPDRDAVLAALAEELLDELSVDEVTIAIAGTTVVGRVPTDSAALTRIPNSGRSASSLAAFGYLPAGRHPAASIGVHSTLRRTFDPTEVALLDSVVDALVRELREPSRAPAPPRARRA